MNADLPHLPGYRVERVLSTGFGGVVAQGVREADGVAVALKACGAEAGEVAQERLRREAEALGRIAHPGLLPLLDAGRVGATEYLVLPYYEGGDLAERLDREGPLPASEVLALAKALAGALAALHDAGVVHRDVKPANVLLDGDGAPRLADLGAGFLADADRITRTQEALGTPRYMAPEVLVGHAPAPGVDVYALGVLLAECLTGARAARPGSPPELPLDLKSRVGSSRELAEVIRRCLRHDPGNRPSSGREVLALLTTSGATPGKTASAEEVTRSLAGLEPSRVAGPEPPAPAEPSAVSPRTGLAVGLVAGLLLAGCGRWLQGASPRGPVARTYTLTTAGAVPALPPGVRLAPSPSGPPFLRLVLEADLGEVEVALPGAGPLELALGADASGTLVGVRPPGGDLFQTLALTPEGRPRWCRDLPGPWRLGPYRVWIPTPDGWAPRRRADGGLETAP